MIKPIGILGESLSWQQILDQERVNYQSVTELTNLNRFGVIILIRNLTPQEGLAVQNYLDSGGGILADFITLKSLLADFRFHQSHKFRYITPASDELFYNVGLTDIGQSGFIPVGFKQPAIYTKSYGAGKIIALPFDLDLALTKVNSRPKFFFAPTTKLPYETVACVSKGEIRKLVINCLKSLLFAQSCYYAHLWYYPNSFRSIFAFRVDTDFSPWRQIEAVFKLAQENKMNFTWFINTKAQEGDLAKFIKLKEAGEDLQLHCYKHNVFTDYSLNYTNIEKGKNLLKAVGIEPIGFAGPFGEWNKSLADALAALGFQFSSEFALNYDDLPFYPIVGSEKSTTLQIPIHPIGVGRLLQAGFDSNQIFIYFKRYIELNYQMREPIMIYDHPHRITQMLQVFDTLFKWVKSKKDIWFTNFVFFMRWWQQRESVNYNATIVNGQLQIETNNVNLDLMLHLISPDGEETFVPLKSGVYPLDQLSWNKLPEPILFGKEILRTRQGEFILPVKEFIITLNRRIKGQRS